MDEKQREQLEKFKIFTRWMYDDCRGALEKAGAQFLVAMALFNYIETLGAFLFGYFQKDASGQIKKCNCRNGCLRCKNGQIRTTSKDRFNAFFAYLGKEYEDLLDKHPELYDELRCGLTHEFLPKNHKFSIIKIPEESNETITVATDGLQIINRTGSPYTMPCSIISSDVNPEKRIMKNIDGSAVNCGVVFFKKEIWQIIVPSLRLDFEIAVKKFIKEIEKENNTQLMNNFFETANQINIENFT